MTPAIVYDAVRLFLGAAARGPRGIDRIDLAYARHLFSTWPADCTALLPTVLGLRRFGRDRVLRGLDRLETLWGEHDPGPYPDLAELAQRPAEPPARPGAGAAGLASLLGATGLAFGAPVRRATPTGALYLNIGQLGWAAPTTTRWLRARPDVRGVFLLHDAIQLDRPDLVVPWARRGQGWLLRIVACHADGLIFSTEDAAAAVLRRLHAAPRSIVAHLPVDGGFLTPPPAPPQPGKAFFLMLGAIEPRKNHATMLEVWSRLHDRLGPATPYLLVAGSVAAGGAPILRRLHAAAGQHVVVATGLSSPGLRQMMRTAQAVLMPSLAEGFGLPVQEALTLATPVLASDLPAHRSVGGPWAQYLPAGSVQAWLDAILMFDPVAARQGLDNFHPVTPGAYFQRIDPFLRSIAASPRVDMKP